MSSRLTSKAAKSRFFFPFLLIIIILSIVYFYLIFTQEHFKNTKLAEKRCISELSSVKYQLDVVTDYKSHVEKMLSESQKAHNLDKEKFKDVAESCLTMKQQSLLCQNQFDDLQNECKKVRETYNKEKIDLEKLKEQLQEEIKRKEEVQHTVDELFAEIDYLRKSNRQISDKLKTYGNNDVNIPPIFENNRRKPVNGRNFSRESEISPGLYEVGIRGWEAAPLKVETKILEKNKQKQKFRRVPPGFAPVLSVIENSDSVNLQKPPNAPKENVAPDKANSNKEQRVGDISKNDDRDLEVVGAVPDAKDSVIVDDNDPLNAPIDHDKLPLGDDVNNENEVNRSAQEDDDEGEEYAA